MPRYRRSLNPQGIDIPISPHEDNGIFTKERRRRSHNCEPPIMHQPSFEFQHASLSFQVVNTLSTQSLRRWLTTVIECVQASAEAAADSDQDRLSHGNVDASGVTATVRVPRPRRPRVLQSSRLTLLSCRILIWRRVHLGIAQGFLRFSRQLAKAVALQSAIEAWTRSGLLLG